VDGSLTVPGDVVIERCTGDEVWVVSSSPAVHGETLTLDVTGAGPAVSMRVRVAESVPVLVGGVVRHGLRLVVVS
jgi:hypothetical protein